jgi:hypothetical protein
MSLSVGRSLNQDARVHQTVRREQSGLKKEASREKKTGSLGVQVGGTHYKNKKIGPAEYIHANGLGFLEGCVVKRMTRWRDKPASNRFEDLEKAKHEIDILIELEKRTGGNS